ncbi:hypothetical protein M408DRAFT_30123 [Serendipita vermifera MAFF 305830]|uniref:F-box domain-containing protein n=1 Tax=Serendipita vermifera MAFF 305830 TaxID=933852 RepID=A0A0C3A7Y5_SERVB|nr:hypothetical protein M408DRAFT_30123 [Serendipita vermifera MAFF 305830]
MVSQRVLRYQHPIPKVARIPVLDHCGIFKVPFNYDILYDIFLNFVAIDWAGPFTLILVCNKWRDIVISNPKLWTLIMVDDSEADWLDRAVIGAHLSQELPLQIVLRVPFLSTTPMEFLTRRRATLIVEFTCQYEAGANRRHLWSFDSIVSYEEFKLNEEEFKNANESVISFLKDGLKDQIVILAGDEQRAGFAYSMWQTYQEVAAGRRLNEIVQDSLQTYITDLRFIHESDNNPARVQLLDVWEILPTLPHLTRLDISDSMVNWSKDTTLAPISLPRLHDLLIESSVYHYLPFCFAKNSWLGLFDLLGYLTASNVENLMLCGSLRRMLAFTMKENIGVLPSNLKFLISYLDESEGGPLDLPTESKTWGRMTAFVIYLPDLDKECSSMAAFEVAVAMERFLGFLPQTCSIKIDLSNRYAIPTYLSTPAIDDPIMNPLMRSDYRTRQTQEHEELVSSLIPSSSSRRFFHWKTPTVQIFIADEDGKLIAKTLDGSLGPPAIMPGDTIIDFSNMTDVRFSTYEADIFISYHKEKSLRVLILHSPTTDIFAKISEHADSLPRLTILGLEYVPTWGDLIRFLGSFNKNHSGGGISVLRLSGLPHPSIVQELKNALNSGPSGYTTKYVDKVFRGPELGCRSCFISGWTCFLDEGDCMRFSGVRMVTITKDPW